MKDIKSIQLILENCDIIDIPYNIIGHFEISNFEDKITRIACNCIAKYTIAHKFAIELFNDGDIEYCEFGIEDLKTQKFKRLMFNDITGIYINYQDGDREEYSFDYEEKNEDAIGSPNIHQTSKISDLGHLYITIGEGIDFDNIFPSDHINDEKHISYIHNIYNIGIEEYDYVELTNELPEKFRYIYLQSKDKTCYLAVMVDDNKFISLDEFKEGFVPFEWRYPNAKIDKFLDKQYFDTDFNLEKIKAKYKKEDV